MKGTLFHLSFILHALWICIVVLNAVFGFLRSVWTSSGSLPPSRTLCPEWKWAHTRYLCFLLIFVHIFGFWCPWEFWNFDFEPVNQWIFNSGDVNFMVEKHFLLMIYFVNLPIDSDDFRNYLLCIELLCHFYILWSFNDRIILNLLISY